jgi:hypothetical protein
MVVVYSPGSSGVMLDRVGLESNVTGWTGGAIHVSSSQSGAVVSIVDSTMHGNASGMYSSQVHTGGGFSFESVPGSRPAIDDLDGEWRW